VLSVSSDAQTRALTKATQNGGYVNPPAIKRAFRDPHGDWWDKQERRNFGEPVHEDNDTLGIFSTEPYTHFQPGHGALLLGAFVASIFVLMGVVRQFYPDKPGVPRTFPGGLDRELGGPGAVPVSRQVYMRDTEMLTFDCPGSYRRGGYLNIHPFIPNSTSFLFVITLIFNDSTREM
jgi:hypothetical protein